MPYRLQPAGGNTFYVVSDSGKRRSKRPLPHKRAMAQMRALYARDPHVRTKAAIDTLPATCTLDDLYNYAIKAGTHYQQDVAEAIAARVPEMVTLKGERIAPGVTRIRGNLCNVHGRYGPCDAALSGSSARATIDRNKRISAAAGRGGGGRGKRPRKGRAAPKPKKTDEQRAQEREQERQQNRDAVKQQMADNDAGLSPSGFDALSGLMSGQQVSGAVGAGLVQMGLAEQAADGSYRITPSGRVAMNAASAGDYQRAVDTISRAQEQAGAKRERTTARQQAQQQREVERAARRQQAEQRRAEAERRRQERQNKGSGGGKKTEPKKDATPAPRRKPSPSRSRGTSRSPSSGSSAGAIGRRAEARRRREERATRETTRQRERAETEQRRQEEQARRAADQAERAGVTTPEIASMARKLSEGGEISEQEQETLIRNGLARRDQDGRMVLTGTGLRASRQKEHASPAAIYGRFAQMSPQTAQSILQPLWDGGVDPNDIDGVWTTPASDRFFVSVGDWADSSTPAKVKAVFGSQVQIEDEAVPGVGSPFSVRVKGYTPLGAFAVFKDAKGQYRWIAHTTTAYRDRDGEILTLKGLEANARRMTETGIYGPLRYWHIGQPNPFSDTEPWGAGLDIGDCDFSMLIGRTLVESGTFRSPAIAEKMAGDAAGYEMSPGFFHSASEPDADGAFETYLIFERSPVPRDYARASNLFTAFRVKEHRMDPKEFERRLKVAEQKLGLSPEQTAAERAALLQTDKDASERKIAFKSDDAPQVYTAPDGTPGIIQDGRFVALKAAAPVAEETMPAVEEKADVVVEEVAAEETTEEGGEETYVGDMTPDEFRTLLVDALQTAIAGSMGAISDKVATLDNELKTFGYARQKEAGEVAALKEQIEARTKEATDLAARLAELEGDQPRAVKSGFRASLNGPVADAATLKELNAPQAPPAGTFDDINQFLLGANGVNGAPRP